MQSALFCLRHLPANKALPIFGRNSGYASLLSSARNKDQKLAGHCLKMQYFIGNCIAVLLKYIRNLAIDKIDGRIT